MECPAIPLKDIRTYLPFVIAMLAAFAVGGLRGLASSFLPSQRSLGFAWCS